MTLRHLADKLQLELADRTPDGRFRTGDKIILTASGAYAAIVTGTVKEVSDEYPGQITITTRFGDFTCSAYSLLHDLTTTASKDLITSYTRY